MCYCTVTTWYYRTYIIAESGPDTGSTKQVNAKYLKQLCSENIIKKTQEILKLSKQNESLAPNEEYISFDVESFLTNASVNDTNNYLLEEIYIQ